MSKGKPDLAAELAAMPIRRAGSLPWWQTIDPAVLAEINEAMRAYGAVTRHADLSRLLHKRGYQVSRLQLSRYYAEGHHEQG